MPPPLRRLQVFDLKEIANDFISLLGKAFCGLIFTGEQILSDDFGGLLGSVLDIASLFSAMPLEASKSYFVAGLAAGITPAQGSSLEVGDFSAALGLTEMGFALAIK